MTTRTASPTVAVAEGAHAELPVGQQRPKVQAVIDRYQALTETLTHLETAGSTGQPGTPAADELLTGRLLAIARQLADVAEPLIDHLPAITAALDDATAWRTADDRDCSDCIDTPGDVLCADHADDHTAVTAYRNALEAIAG